MINGAFKGLLFHDYWASKDLLIKKIVETKIAKF